MIEKYLDSVPEIKKTNLSRDILTFAASGHKSAKVNATGNPARDCGAYATTIKRLTRNGRLFGVTIKARVIEGQLYLVMEDEV